MLNKLKLLLILIATSYSAWAIGYYQGESNANEGLIALEQAGLIEPFYVDSVQPAMWVRIND